MESKYIEPPDIGSMFSKHLLSSHGLKCDSETNKMLFDKVTRKFEKKNMCNTRKQKYENLKKEYLELYEYAKKKEDEKREVPNKTKGWMYRIKLPNQRDEAIYRGLKYGVRAVYPAKELRYNRVQKVRYRKRKIK